MQSTESECMGNSIELFKKFLRILGDFLLVQHEIDFAVVQHEIDFPS